MLDWRWRFPSLFDVSIALYRVLYFCNYSWLLFDDGVWQSPE
jgi:hypothetical protein